MTGYEQMMKYQIGIEMGLLNMNDLNDFLSAALRENDVPYIYTDVFLSLPKGEEAVTEAIFYNLRDNFSVDRSAGNMVQRLLIGEIRRKYESGAISLDECIQFLRKLTDYSDCSWELISIEEYYELYKSGFQNKEDFEKNLSAIFSLAVM